MQGVTAAWLAETVVITYRAAKQNSDVPLPIPHLPLPSTYTGSFVVYGALSFVGGRAAPVATLTAWMITLATVLDLWTPGGSVKQLSSAAPPATTTGA